MKLFWFKAGLMTQRKKSIIPYNRRQFLPYMIAGTAETIAVRWMFPQIIAKYRSLLLVCANG